MFEKEVSMRKLAVAGILLIPINVLAEPSAETPLAQEWDNTLRGKTLTEIKSNSSGYGEFYSYSRFKAVTYLCRDGRFIYQEMSSSSVGRSTTKSQAGYWRIISEGDVAFFEITFEHGGGGYLRLDYAGGQIYFNGNLMYVTDDNTMC